tara:strand:+ start:89 stop:334 length:246 start_codon:yes stop_codon:yes gene_type:complete
MAWHTTQRMEQSNINQSTNHSGHSQSSPNDAQKRVKPATSKMVSFRMPIAYIEQLQQQAQALGKSKSQVLRMGLDELKNKK